MLTTNSLVVDEFAINRELQASLVYHPFKAHVPLNTVAVIGGSLTLARFDGKTYEDALDDVTQILLADKGVSGVHTGDEVAAIAYGMVQRVHEITAFPSGDNELESTQLIF